MYVSKDAFDLSATDKARLSTFEDWIWYNSEVCNECFSRVRVVGEEVLIRKDKHTHRVNSEFKRTDNGSQEHNPFRPPSHRYGDCFCENCGGDLKASKDRIPDSRFKNYLVNVHDYTYRHTPLSLDRDTFAQEALRLRKRPAVQYKGRQVIAVAFARALERAGPRPTSGESDDRLRADGGTRCDQ